MEHEQGYSAIDTSVCVHLHEIGAEPLAWQGGAAVACQPLRRHDDGSLRSAVLTLPAGWSVGEGEVAAATTQMYVMEGALSLGERALPPAGYAVVPAGARWPAVAAQADSRVVVILDPPGVPVDLTEPLLVPDVMALAPFTPVIAGRRLDGFERRVLWLNEATGADTRLLRVPAGFRGGGPNWHPVQEEIFCLEGDIAPDETRPMRAGSFLWNPARSVHGFDEHTAGGCVLLEWHDGAWALTPAPEVVR